MAYDQVAIANAVISALEAKPAGRLSEIAKKLGVDRHTVNRALASQRLGSFRDLQRSCQLRRFGERMAGGSALSVKEVAVGLGYEHAHSFSRRFRQLNGKAPSKSR